MPETETQPTETPTPAPEILASDGSNLAAKFGAIDAKEKDETPAPSPAEPAQAAAPSEPEWDENADAQPWLKTRSAAEKALASAAEKIRKLGTERGQLERQLREREQAAPTAPQPPPAKEEPKEDPRIARLKELRLIDPYGEEHDRLRDELDAERIEAKARETYERARATERYNEALERSVAAGKSALQLVMARHGLTEEMAGQIMYSAGQYYKEFITSGGDPREWNDPEVFVNAAYALNPLLKSHATVTPAATVQVPVVPQNTPAPPTSGKPSTTVAPVKPTVNVNEKDEALANVFGSAAGLSAEAQKRLAEQFARI